MAMETVATLAHATGRILVMPPEEAMYLISKVWFGATQALLRFRPFQFSLICVVREMSGTGLGTSFPLKSWQTVLVHFHVIFIPIHLCVFFAPLLNNGFPLACRCDKKKKRHS
jgi:hypothetical protein